MSAVLPLHSLAAMPIHRRWIVCICFAAFALACLPAQAAGPTRDIQQLARKATFEVVRKKIEPDNLSYEKPLPLELLPFRERNDRYWSVGTAFVIAPNVFVSAGHIFAASWDASLGTLLLRDAEGKVYPIDRILKYSRAEDFVVFSVTGAPTVVPLAISEHYAVDDEIYAVGNAFGEGVIIRDGLLTSETPEELDGRWNWLRFSAAASPGNSGGPLLDRKGSVIGVVIRKSPNENLNYALPIGRVLKDTGDVAKFEALRSRALPNLRASDAKLYKGEIPLPKTFDAFSRATEALLRRVVERDFEELADKYRDQILPMGKAEGFFANADLLDLPRIAQQDSDDEWGLPEPEGAVKRDLPGGGSIQVGMALVDAGISSFRIRRTDTDDDPGYYSDPRILKAALPVGLGLVRNVGGQAIKLTALGAPAQTSRFEDHHGRPWQVCLWPLPHLASTLVVYATPVPDGYAGILTLAAAGDLPQRQKMLEWAADFVTFGYEGTLKQWSAFLKQPDLHPPVLNTLSFKLDSSKAFIYESPRVAMMLPQSLLPVSEASVLVLQMQLMRNGPGLLWDVGGLRLSSDRGQHEVVGIMRHGKPGDAARRELREGWAEMLDRGSDYRGLAQRDAEFKVLSATQAITHRVASDPGNDPAALVVYEASYRTDRPAFPGQVVVRGNLLLDRVQVLEP